MAKQQSKVPQGAVDALSNELLAAINLKFKDHGHQAAYYLSDPNVATDVKDWIPTGHSILDLAISNRPYGGWPVGKIIEITGLEASGKSLLGAYALANTQKKGGIAVYIDTESAVSREYLTAIGVDVTKLMYLQLEALEDIFASVEAIIEKVRSSDRKKLVTILVDSVMGATTLKEMEADYGKDGYATDKAIILSKAMRKITGMISKENICLIFTNQLRQKLGVSFGDNWTTSGGKALAFHSSVRIRLKSLGQIKAKSASGVEGTVGIKTKAQVVKNRLGPPLKVVEYDIYFNSGIDDYGSWIEELVTHKVLVKSGHSYILTFPEMEIVNPKTAELAKVTELKFQSKNFAGIMDHNPKLREYVYNILCEKLIMTYKVNEDFGVDDITITSDDFISEEG